MRRVFAILFAVFLPQIVYGQKESDFFLLGDIVSDSSTLQNDYFPIKKFPKDVGLIRESKNLIEIRYAYRTSFDYWDIGLRMPNDTWYIIGVESPSIRRFVVKYNEGRWSLIRYSYLYTVDGYTIRDRDVLKESQSFIDSVKKCRSVNVETLAEDLSGQVDVEELVSKLVANNIFSLKSIDRANEGVYYLNKSEQQIVNSQFIIEDGETFYIQFKVGNNLRSYTFCNPSPESFPTNHEHKDIKNIEMLFEEIFNL